MKKKYYHPYNNPNGEKREGYESMVTEGDLPTFIVRLKRLLLYCNWFDKAGRPSDKKDYDGYQRYEHIFLMGARDAYRCSFQFRLYKDWISVKVSFTDDIGLHFYSYLVLLDLGTELMKNHLPFGFDNTKLNNEGFIKWMNNGEVKPFTREEVYTELMEFLYDYTALDAMVDVV